MENLMKLHVKYYISNDFTNVNIINKYVIIIIF